MAPQFRFQESDKYYGTDRHCPDMELEEWRHYHDQSKKSGHAQVEWSSISPSVAQIFHED